MALDSRDFLARVIALQARRVRVLHALRIDDQERAAGVAPPSRAGRANLIFLKPAPAGCHPRVARSRSQSTSARCATWESRWAVRATGSLCAADTTFLGSSGLHIGLKFGQFSHPLLKGFKAAPDFCSQLPCLAMPWPALLDCLPATEGAVQRGAFAFIAENAFASGVQEAAGRTSTLGAIDGPVGLLRLGRGLEYGGNIRQHH